MAKTRAQKEAIVGQLADQLKQAKAAVFSTYVGLSVKDFEDLRQKLRDEQARIIVAKKSLLSLALKNANVTGIDAEAFETGVAVTTSASDEVAPARILAAFAKTHPQVKFLGGVMEGNTVDIPTLTALAALPGKTQLLGQLVAAVGAPISGLVNVLQGNLRGLVQVLKAKSEQPVH